jgi:hypothetical protein
MMSSWQSNRPFVLSTLVLWLSLACSASNPSGNGGKGGTGLGGSSGAAGQNGSGGSAGGGGSVATAGTAGQSGSGGQPGTGGAKGSGGATASGGTTGPGGTTGSGGATSTGGATGSGGAPHTGGATGLGGTAGAGGTIGSGGATGVGGATGPGGTTGADGGTAVAGAIYVAPDGDDANPGTLAQPLKTVAKARDLVRTKNSAMTSDLTVYLRGGTYPQTSTLTFANADSGNGGFYVKYMAYPGERPLITGGQPIKGWKVSDATNNIYSASAGTTAFRQLYVNGVKAIRARTPNLLANSVANFNRLSGWDKTANNLQVPNSAVATWNNLTKVEMHVNIAWGDSTLHIASITSSGVPRPGRRVVPRRDHEHGLLQATHRRGHDDVHGHRADQAGQYNLTADANNNQTVGRMTAGVSVMNANHMHFERNLVTQMGGTGLDFISGTHDDTIIGNAITDIAGNGISVGKFTASDTTEFHVAYNPSDKNEICTRETVKDNYISNVTTEILGGVGIGAGYPANIDIEHNEISYTNYTGISVGFGWTSTPNAMTNNKINYNNIHHVNQIITDGGAIYTLSNQGPTSEMQYNYIHDYACSKWADYGCNGLYMDEQTSGYTVAHNVMVNCPTNIAQNKNGTNTVTDNGGNPSGAQNTIATAGIEATYADIKTLTVPAATF